MFIYVVIYNVNLQVNCDNSMSAALREKKKCQLYYNFSKYWSIVYCSLKNIEYLFNEMAQNGFDTSKPLKWGFYFLSKDKNKLFDVYAQLEDKAYQLEEIRHREDNMWQLFVTKVDILNEQKLHKRNLAFNELAEYCEVEGYDGWDVERIQ